MARTMPLKAAAAVALAICFCPTSNAQQRGAELPTQRVILRVDENGKRFDGIGAVNGGGATSVLLKDYPEPQRSQILDLIFRPKFGASITALLVEIPGDGNSTQGSMPSHMHTRDDLNYQRGYTWWLIKEAKRRNPHLTLTGMAWSAPGWIGNGDFWTQDAADYYVKWLSGLRKVYGIEFDAIGLRNEKGGSFAFAKILRKTLDANGFSNVKVQGFDDWPKDKLQFVREMLADQEKRNAIDIISAHTFNEVPPTDGDKIREWSHELKKPVWNSEEHVYKSGFDCALSIVQAFNLDYIRYGVTLTVNWYDIAGLYPMEPYSETPAALLARSPWSGHYQEREALWGYAHYGQFTAPGWTYVPTGSGELNAGGSFVTLRSPKNDLTIIIESKSAKGPQQMQIDLQGLLPGKQMHAWRSNSSQQFKRQPDLSPANGTITITLEPNAIYTLTTTTGQQKGAFANVPEDKPFPFPYYEKFEEYASPERFGYLPRYTADIDDAFQVADRPDGKGLALRQVVPFPPNSWAPEWNPYTILGDDQWHDYDVSADVYLNPGDTAGVMGRVNSVGTGYGTIPKGYFLSLAADGLCRLVVVRGKISNAPVGDADQQALARSKSEALRGGELELAATHLDKIAPREWHTLKLRFEGTRITGSVDGKQVLSAENDLYLTGMAGLMTGGGAKVLSTPFFDNVAITGKSSTRENPQPLPSLSPMYSATKAAQ